MKTKQWAALWSVRFNTKDGMIHPVRYGKSGGPQIGMERIKIAAEKYLADNSDWLESINCIEPLDKP